jgi:hypothetical protein
LSAVAPTALGKLIRFCGGAGNRARPANDRKPKRRIDLHGHCALGVFETEQERASEIRGDQVNPVRPGDKVVGLPRAVMLARAIDATDGRLTMRSAMTTSGISQPQWVVAATCPDTQVFK